MRKSLLITTTILSGLALATAAQAASHGTVDPAKTDTVLPSTTAADQDQDRTTAAPTADEGKTATETGSTYRSFNKTKNFSGTIAGGYTASGLLGAELLGPDGESVGEISDLLIDSNNEVKNVLVDTNGFLGIGRQLLGIGSKSVAVDLASVTREDDKLVVSMSEDLLETKVVYVEKGDQWIPEESKS